METSTFTRRFSIPDFLSYGIFIMLIVGAGYYVYANRPCGNPLTYRIGTFDQKFRVNEGDFLLAAQEAADLWNKEAGRSLLAYDPQSAMTVNLIFDARQQTTNAGQSIDNKETALTAEKAHIRDLQNQYDAARQQLHSDEAAGKDPAALNAEIDVLNKMGRELQSQAYALNLQIDQVNGQARTFNSQNGKDFNEGEYLQEYGRRTINLYEFKNHTQLVRVLAHEFGHSLGMDHNANPNSIMYPVNTATTIALTPEDKAALIDSCKFSLANLHLSF